MVLSASLTISVLWAPKNLSDVKVEHIRMLQIKHFVRFAQQDFTVTNDMTQMFSTKPVLLVFTVQMVLSKPLSSLVLWVHSATYLVCRMSQNVLLVLVATTVMNLGRQHTLSCAQKDTSAEVDQLWQHLIIMLPPCLTTQHCYVHLEHSTIRMQVHVPLVSSVLLEQLSQRNAHQEHSATGQSSSQVTNVKTARPESFVKHLIW